MIANPRLRSFRKQYLWCDHDHLRNKFQIIIVYYSAIRFSLVHSVDATITIISLFSLDPHLPESTTSYLLCLYNLCITYLLPMLYSSRVSGNFVFYCLSLVINALSMSKKKCCDQRSFWHRQREEKNSSDGETLTVVSALTAVTGAGDDDGQESSGGQDYSTE